MENKTAVEQLEDNFEKFIYCPAIKKPPHIVRRPTHETTNYAMKKYYIVNTGKRDVIAELIYRGKNYSDCLIFGKHVLVHNSHLDN